MPTIKLFAPNLKGNDYFIADLHGNKECLYKIFDLLTKDDRLFIGGDMTDRGPGSFDVIAELQAMNKNGYQVYAVKGNHEDMCLYTIAALERIIRRIARKKPADIDEYFLDRASHDGDIEAHVHNGGKWLVELFTDEYEDGDISVENGKVIYKNNCSIKILKEYLQALPYIAHVTGDDPLNAVHADMPFDDEELKKRLASNTELTQDEINYATWARETGDTPFVDTGRTKDSVLTYCGHNIVILGAECVRADNTIVGDVGCYYTNVIMLINHTKKTAQFVGDMSKNDEETKAKLSAALAEVNAHLQSRSIKPAPTFASGTLFANDTKRKESSEESEKPDAKRVRTEIKKT